MNSSRFPELKTYHDNLFIYHYGLLTQFEFIKLSEYENTKKLDEPSYE